MKKFILTTCLLSSLILSAIAQIGIGTNTPNASSILDLTSNDKAFLPPRMNTTARNAIQNPVAGMVIYNTDSTCIELYKNSAWFNLCSVVPPLFSGNVIPLSPVSVAKTSTKKVFAHVMPWFETPTSNTLNPGSWGQHWTMNAAVSPPTTIASHYYPLTGPYASNDTTIIDYQLLLMKLSGIDGILIDWYGSSSKFDFPMLERNTSTIVSRLAKAGLSFALVYEDFTVSSATNQITQAQSDMAYAQTNYFSKSNYEKINGSPLLLVFGPRTITGSTNWNSVFTSLSPKPTFLTYMFNTGGGTASNGQFAWVESSNTTRLNQFYATSPGMKMTAAYPGFNSYYALGGTGWSNVGNPTWVIAANGTSNFQTTLNLAIQQADQYIQLPTWNDYGEGTMIEPTTTADGGFGYSLLTTLQQTLGVTSLAQADLEAVYTLYQLRKSYAGNATALAKLNQVYYYIVSLQMTKAKALLATLQ
ncbi:hypothetical protein LK994_10595 [Ferruginibacter lapsinanis]|uniref:glycoside hydrolase family 71/99-like protein n=1 Tax=Ferruginibacter lapsinanis TaxID=563172 RepID=UPI001E48ECAC|nr:glycoside hydrolase family 71/99-like protein [Ferruginibacter lapsinanis]UEG49078.1 hypothetical protein LK994_10595 [Ferruginibacter lapsinanis]